VAIATTDPTAGKTLEEFEALGSAALEGKLAQAAAAFAKYRGTSFAQRATWLERAADILDDENDRLATIITREMGKPLPSARAEVAKCAIGARFYARHAEQFLADEPVPGEAVGASKAYTHWQPLGPVLAVMPWNFPFWQVMRFAAPTLMAGNVGLLKHASNVPRSALAFEDIFTRAGLPEGVFQTLLIDTSQIESVINDSRVVAVTLTGSEGAGRSVGALAGRAVKKSVLELGGNDPYIVLPSADLAQAAAVGVQSRCQNTGQSCVAAKRFIVHADVVDEFRDLLVKGMAELVMGDPMAPGTDVGPLATPAGLADVSALVRDAVDRGATVLLGGHPGPGPGWFFEPTLLTDITEDMRIYREELFGPVAQLYTVPDLDGAIELANATDLGLSASAWTDDEAEQAVLIDGLECGAVFINGMSVSYPELPFGGIKNSGHGRELAAMGIKEFCNAKTVWVRSRGGAGTPADC